MEETKSPVGTNGFHGSSRSPESSIGKARTICTMDQGVRGSDDDNTNNLQHGKVIKSADSRGFSGHTLCSSKQHLPASRYPVFFGLRSALGVVSTAGHFFFFFSFFFSFLYFFHHK